jgi:hypothetical protein
VPRQPRCSVVVFGVLLGLRLVRRSAAGRRAWARRLAPVGRSCHAWPRFGGGSWLWESRPSSSRCRARRNRRITNSSRSSWSTAGAGAASAKGRARGRGLQPYCIHTSYILQPTKSFVLGQPGRAPRQPRGGREGGACSPTYILHPAANQVVRPGTAGAGAASAKGRARGALMGGSPVSPAIKSFVLGQPGRARPATGLVMQGLRHPYLSIYLLDNCTKYIQ